jgi:glycosyltransferase involved in cell wall biosynthesis
MVKNKKKTKILLVLLQISAGGSERVALDLARSLDQTLFDPYLAYFTEGVLHKAFGKVCHELFHVQKKEGLDFSTMLQLSKIIRERSIDIVNAHHYAAFFYSYLGSKILNKKNLIYTEHSVADVESISGLHQKICTCLLYNTNAVAAVSKEVRQSVIKTFPSHSRKVVCIPNGVEIERFTSPLNSGEIRKQLNIYPYNFIIGTIANFKKVKNHRILIHAFYKLSLVYPKLRLVLVGRSFAGDKENSETEILSLLHSLGLANRVILTGYREDIASILKSFDVFCLPSLSEGLPVSVLEAMAAGVPVVGTDVRGIREVILNEKTGLLVPSDNVDSLAASLERLILDPLLRESLKRSAFEFVRNSHGFKNWISSYEFLFQRAKG